MEYFTKDFLVMELQGFLPNDIYKLIDTSKLFRNLYQKMGLFKIWNFNRKHSHEFCNNMNKFSYAIENTQKQLSLKVTNLHLVKKENICNLGKVYSLDLNCCYGVTSRIVGTLGNVHTLSLINCHNVNDKCLKYLGKLHSLDLSGCKQVSDRGVRYLGKLDTLNLTNCSNVTIEGIKHLNNIKNLTLSYCSGIHGIPIEFISNSHNLSVIDSRIRDVTNLKNLNSLCLTNLLVVPKGIRELNAKNLNISINNKGISNGQILDLVNKEVLNYKLELSCCKNILNSSLQYFGNLYSLNLSYCCKISDEGIKHLGKCQRLNLFGCYDITDNGLKFLSKVKIIILDPYFTRNITEECLIDLGNVFVEGTKKRPIQSWSPFKRKGHEICW